LITVTLTHEDSVTFKYSRPVRLQDTDAAGILFFANWIVIAHEAYESMMADIGFDFASMIDSGDFLVLIVHVENNYSAAVRLGDVLTVELTVTRLGDSSFTIDYSFTKLDGSEAGTCRTVHAATDSKSGLKIPLPDKFRAALARYSSD
jgi:YbgC/YbaW family acyl-CoA thioester hydrolase